LILQFASGIASSSVRRAYSRLKFQWRESFYILACEQRPRHLHKGNQELTLEHLFCLRCNRELESGQKSVAVYMFAQTVGIRPRQKSPAQRICFCPQCSVSLAMGPPPEGALNMAAWQMIREMVSADPALNQAAWEAMSGITGFLSPNRAAAELRQASGGGYVEF
jgi:hypothetical protein